MIRVGPSSSPIVGKAWDYKGKSEVVEIFISYDKIVDSIQFLYADDDGKLILSKVHGDANPNMKFKAVMFDYPSEFLTSVSGACSNNTHGYRVISTITFGTNKSRYGPYGIGSPMTGGVLNQFDYQFGPFRSFGGFHGSSLHYYNSNTLESIGVYIKPIASLKGMNKNASAQAQKVKEEKADDLPL